MTRALKRVIATTDVHSHLGDATAMLAHLHQCRDTALVVDCGDFFEGTGLYRLGHGSVERQVLLSLYDVLAPGNHGWQHHFEPGLRELTVCANVVADDNDEPLFRRLHLARIGERTVAVTAVIGVQAFNAVPARHRAGHRVLDPAHALAELVLEQRQKVDAWILLSHSGFDEDLKLASTCQFLDVIFGGHCHSDHYAPERVGNTLVVKGAELAVGYALAEPASVGWRTGSYLFPPAATLPYELEQVGKEIALIAEQLAAPLGVVTDRWQHRVPDRRELLAEVAEHLHTVLGSPAVILNETALRPTAALGGVLHLGELMAVEPFDNQLVHAPISEVASSNMQAMLARLADSAGALVVSPDPLPISIRSILTTDYLADTFLDGGAHGTGLRLGEAVRAVLLPRDGEGEPK